MKIFASMGQDTLAGVRVPFLSVAVQTRSHTFEHRHFIDTTSYAVIDGERPNVLREMKMLHACPGFQYLQYCARLERGSIFNVLRLYEKANLEYVAEREACGFELDKLNVRLTRITYNNIQAENRPYPC